MRGFPTHPRPSFHPDPPPRIRPARRGQQRQHPRRSRRSRRIGLSIRTDHPASANPNKKISATSDTDGRFAFENLPAGRYKLTYSGQGFATQVVSLELHTSESLEAPSVTLLFSSATTDVQVNASTEEIAEAQIKEEEQQRIFGAIPNFYVVYHPTAIRPRSPQSRSSTWPGNPRSTRSRSSSPEPSPALSELA